MSVSVICLECKCVSALPLEVSNTCFEKNIPRKLLSLFRLSLRLRHVEQYESNTQPAAELLQPNKRIPTCSTSAPTDLQKPKARNKCILLHVSEILWLFILQLKLSGMEIDTYR